MPTPNCASKVSQFTTEKKHGAFSVICSSFGSMPGLIGDCAPFSSATAIWLMMSRVISLSFWLALMLPAAVEYSDHGRSGMYSGFRPGRNRRSEFRRPRIAAFGSNVLEVQVFFGEAHLRIGRLEDRAVEQLLFLRIEVIEDEPLGRCWRARRSHQCCRIGISATPRRGYPRISRFRRSRRAAGSTASRSAASQLPSGIRSLPAQYGLPPSWTDRSLLTTIVPWDHSIVG